MGIEIERKFLVRGTDFMAGAVGHLHLVQGYLSRRSGCTVRVRTEEDAACGSARGWLTVKGRSTADGTTRSEWEFPVPFEEARGMFPLCEGSLIDKDRYIVPAGTPASAADAASGEDAVPAAADALASAGGDASAEASGLRWEVDVFHGRHEGLIVAEIELDDPGRRFPRPAWLGEEVTGDRRYYNSVLAAE